MPSTTGSPINLPLFPNAPPAITPTQATQIALGVAVMQTAYALNNGIGFVVGQPLNYIDDSGNLSKSGAVPLPLSIPDGYIVQGVYKNDDNGADVFVAYNQATNQAGLPHQKSLTINGLHKGVVSY
jgi:hypothetical protein